MTYCPQPKILLFLGGVNDPDTSFGSYIMSVMTLNVFALRKNRWIFELCHYFILFLSKSGAASVKNRQKPIFFGL